MIGKIAISLALAAIAAMITVVVGSILPCPHVHFVIQFLGSVPAQIWGGNVDAVTVLSVTSALVAALFAVCVTVYIFLFGELSGGAARSKGASMVASKLQDRHRSDIERILTSVIVFIALNYGSIFAKNWAGDNFGVDAIITCFIVLSIMLCIWMVWFCRGLVGFKSGLLEIAEEEFRVAVDAWSDAEGEGGYRGANAGASGMSNRSKAYNRNAVGALHAIVMQIDDDKVIESANAQGKTTDDWTLLKGCFLRCEEARDALNEVAGAGEGASFWSSRGGAEGARIEEAALFLREKLWEGILSKRSYTVRPLERQQFSNLDLSGINLSGALATRARFTSCNMTKTLLRNAELRYGEVADCILAGADLSGADCECAVFRNCDISRMTLSCGLEEGELASVQGSRQSERSLPITLSRDTKLKRASFDGSSLVAALLSLPPKRNNELRETQIVPGGQDSESEFSLDECSFRDVSFRDSRAENIGMRKTVWTGSVLSSSTIIGCNLISSNLSNAVLSETTLRDCDMGRALLSNAYMGNSRCEKCNMSFATLDRFVIEESVLVGCVFSYASMDSLRVVKSKVECVPFFQARGDGARFVGGEYVGCAFAYCLGGGWTFLGAKLRRCHYERVRLEKADFSGCEMSKCEMFDSDLTSSSFCGAKLEGEGTIENTLFGGASFVGATVGCGVVVKGCVFSQASFVKADIRDARFEECSFSRSVFRYAEIHDSCFVRSDFVDVEFGGAVFCDVTFDDVDEPLLRKALLGAKTIENVTVNGKVFEGR